jgi:hypothetical protein
MTAPASLPPVAHAPKPQVPEFPTKTPHGNDQIPNLCAWVVLVKVKLPFGGESTNNIYLRQKQRIKRTAAQILSGCRKKCNTVT